MSNKNKIILCIFSILIIIVLITQSSIFNIKTVNVVGNNIVESNIILRDSNLADANGNIFLYNSRKYEKELKKNAYFETVNIKKSLPSKIDIILEEREIAFYVLYSNNTYLYLDKNAIVIDTKQNTTLNYPIIKGLEFDSFTVGEPLIVKNKEALDNAKIITRTINRYINFDDQITIDINKSNNIHLYVKNINVVFGDAQNVDLKVRRMIATIPLIDDDLKGYLYVDDVSRDAYFKIIT